MKTDPLLWLDLKGESDASRTVFEGAGAVRGGSFWEQDVTRLGLRRPRLLPREAFVLPVVSCSVRPRRAGTGDDIAHVAEPGHCQLGQSSLPGAFVKSTVFWEDARL